MRRRIRILHISAFVLVVSAATGCSGSDEYAIPAKVCDVKVPKKTTAALLTKGGELEEGKSSDALFETGCTLTVDEKWQLSVGEHRTNEKVNPATLLAPSPDSRFGIRTLHGLPPEMHGAAKRRRALATIKCRTGGSKYLLIEVKIRQTVRDEPSRELKDLGRFTEEYVPRAAEKLKCR